MESIEFYIASDTEKTVASNVEITNSNILSTTNKPVNGGIMDLHMGTIEFKERCASCGNDSRTCTGHMAHLKLKFDIINPLCVGYLLNQ